jgi:DNA-binding IclR family transcriptional regulator
MAVLAVVRKAGTQGIPRVEVAAQMGLTLHEAYLALNRLQHRGLVKNTRKNNAHFWVFQAPAGPAEGE